MQMRGLAVLSVGVLAVEHEVQRVSVPINDNTPQTQPQMLPRNGQHTGGVGSGQFTDYLARMDANPVPSFGFHQPSPKFEKPSFGFSSESMPSTVPHNLPTHSPPSQHQGPVTSGWNVDFGAGLTVGQNVPYQQEQSGFFGFLPDQNNEYADSLAAAGFNVEEGPSGFMGGALSSPSIPQYHAPAHSTIHNIPTITSTYDNTKVLPSTHTPEVIDIADTVLPSNYGDYAGYEGYGDYEGYEYESYDGEEYYYYYYDYTEEPENHFPSQTSAHLQHTAPSHSMDPHQAAPSHSMDPHQAAPSHSMDPHQEVMEMLHAVMGPGAAVDPDLLQQLLQEMESNTAQTPPAAQAPPQPDSLQLPRLIHPTLPLKPDRDTESLSYASAYDNIYSDYEYIAPEDDSQYEETYNYANYVNYDDFDMATATLIEKTPISTINTISTIKTISGCTCKASTEVLVYDEAGTVTAGGHSHDGCGTGRFEAVVPTRGMPWCDTVEPNCNDGKGWDLCHASTSTTASTDAHTLSTAPAPAAAPRDETVRCLTTQGAVLIEVMPSLSPQGAQRFLQLVRDDFFTGAPLFRVVPDSVVQFGVPESPVIKSKYPPIPDDPSLGVEFEAGTLSFAGSGPNSRTTQVFISYASSDYLGTADRSWETPFGRVLNMHVVQSFNSNYGQGPDPRRMTQEGFQHLKTDFPGLDYILNCEILPTAPSPEVVEERLPSIAPAAPTTKLPMPSKPQLAPPTLNTVLQTLTGCTCRPSSEVIIVEVDGSEGGGLSHYGCGTGPYEHASPAQGLSWCDTVESSCRGGQGWDYCTPSWVPEEDRFGTLDFETVQALEQQFLGTGRVVVPADAATTAQPPQPSRPAAAAISTPSLLSSLLPPPVTASAPKLHQHDQHGMHETHVEHEPEPEVPAAPQPWADSFGGSQRWLEAGFPSSSTHAARPTESKTSSSFSSSRAVWGGALPKSRYSSMSALNFNLPMPRTQLGR